VESSCCCFAVHSGCCDVQNDGTGRSNAFGSHVSQQISNCRVFSTKNGQKGNFLWKVTEFSLWSLRVVVSRYIRGAAMSKMMGRTDLMLLEAMYPNIFPTVAFFQPKKARKGIFYGKIGNFLSGVFVFLFRGAFRVL